MNASLRKEDEKWTCRSGVAGSDESLFDSSWVFEMTKIPADLMPA
jgi:hypothetical protein